MSLQHASPTPWGVAKCGDETQLGPLASTDQRDFPYHMLSAQMKKLSKEWRKWEAFIIFNVCLLEQLLHMWKCSFPGSGQTLLVDGKVENNFFFPPFFVHTTFHFGLVNCLIMTYALFSALFPSPPPAEKGSDGVACGAAGAQPRSTQLNEPQDF